MYHSKKRVDLSHLFKLSFRKRQPIVRINCNDGNGWQVIKGVKVVSFTPPVTNS